MPGWLLRSQRGRALLVAGGIAVLLLWLAYANFQPRKLLAARIAAQLDTTPESDLATPLRQLTEFGRDGLPHLVEALKNERPALAREARSVLSEELDRWQLLPQRESSQRLALLASELARGIESCSPTTRRLASDLATRILLWPVDANVVDQQQLIGDCERVLIAVRGSEPPTVVPMQVATNSVSPRNPSDLSPLDEGLSLPGGGLPVEMQPAPPLPVQERAQPRVLPIEEPNLSPVLPPGEEPRPFVPETTPRAQRDRQATTTLDRIYQLVSHDTDVRDGAEGALRQEGFSEAHLAVARRFADSRPEVRRELVTQLARQTVVDARPWLLRLVADEDRTVRLAAARVLITSSDPQTLRQLREREAMEPDADVRAVLASASAAE